MKVARIIIERTKDTLISYGMDKTVHELNVLSPCSTLVAEHLTSIFSKLIMVCLRFLQPRETYIWEEKILTNVFCNSLSRMRKKSNSHISVDNRALQNLRKEVERIKCTLSTQQQDRLEIDITRPDLRS